MDMLLTMSMDMPLTKLLAMPLAMSLAMPLAIPFALPMAMQCNMNIKIWTEYEYEYIRNLDFDRI